MFSANTKTELHDIALPTMDVENLRILAAYSADVICRFGLDKRLHYVSPSCVHVLGWTPEEMVAHPPLHIIVPEDVPLVLEAIEKNYTKGSIPSSVTARNIRKDGSIVWLEVAPRVIWDEDGEPVETVITMRDVTERKRAEDELAKLAYTDSLTGLANRRAFDAALTREWVSTLEEGSQISLLLIDIDNFKLFNDRHGHQAGDDCLRAIAAAVQASINDDGIVARYGGEEIAVILPNEHAATAMNKAECARLKIASLGLHYGDVGEITDVVTASIGVATALARCGGSIEMPSGLMTAADKALYRAKHQGKNRVASALLLAPKTREHI